MSSELLEYETQPFLDFHHENSLLIIAKGLGLERFLLNYIRLYLDPGNLVFVLNCTQSDAQHYISKLQDEGEQYLPKIINEYSVTKRSQMYREGGLFFVSTRILIVDLLTSTQTISMDNKQQMFEKTLKNVLISSGTNKSPVIPLELLQGIILDRAHVITSKSGGGEAFILKIIQRINEFRAVSNDNISNNDCEVSSDTSNADRVWIKAVSQTPWAFTRSVEGNNAASFLTTLQHTVVHRLHVNQCILLPRFQSDVKAYLEAVKPSIIECRIKATPNVREMQNLLFQLLQTCIQEIRVSCPLTNVFLQEKLVLETVLSTNFLETLHVKLDPWWDELGVKTQNLIHSLRTLRRLTGDLYRLDALSYYTELCDIRKRAQKLAGLQSFTTNIHNDTTWLLEPTSELLFQLAKNRIDINEQNPKFTNLTKILSNILSNNDTFNFENESKHIKSAQTFFENEKNDIKSEFEPKINTENIVDFGITTNKSPTICIMVKHQDTITDIQTYISKAKLFDNNFNNKIVENTLQSNDDISKIDIKNEEYIMVPENNKKKSFTKFNKNINKRLKTTTFTGGKSIKNKKIITKNNGLPPTQSKRTFETQNFGNINMSYLDSQMIHCLCYTDIISKTGNLIDTWLDLNADHIIINDPDLYVTRQIEVYQALRHRNSCNKLFGDNNQNVDDNSLEQKANDKNQQLLMLAAQIKVYFLVYEDSLEEQSYLTSLKQEKNAFENLIAQKRDLVIPTNHETYSTSRAQQDNTLIPSTSGVKFSNEDTRKSGGLSMFEKAQRNQNSNIQKQPPAMIILIDVREFRSDLPSVLYDIPITETQNVSTFETELNEQSTFQNYITLIPLTLRVGDYILTPQTCVERKSIPDLVQSFASGRLYTQCQSMVSAFTRPILLLEFDDEFRPFWLKVRPSSYNKNNTSMTSGTTFSSEISPFDIQSKLVLLTKTFPTLRLIWSTNPAMTARLFIQLKRHKEEPNPDNFVGDSTITQSTYTQAARNMLIRMPGLNTRNVALIYNKIPNLTHLCTQTTLEELTQILENKIAAQKLYNFLHPRSTLSTTKKSSL